MRTCWLGEPGRPNRYMPAHPHTSTARKDSDEGGSRSSTSVLSSTPTKTPSRRSHARRGAAYTSSRRIRTAGRAAGTGAVLVPHHRHRYQGTAAQITSRAPDRSRAPTEGSCGSTTTVPGMTDIVGFAVP